MSSRTGSPSSHWCCTASVPTGSTCSTSQRAALSTRGQLALLRRMHDLCAEGSQFVVATHSPILLAYQGALIYELDATGITRTAYLDTSQYHLASDFLASPERFIRHLFSDDRLAARTDAARRSRRWRRTRHRSTGAPWRPVAPDRHVGVPGIRRSGTVTVAHLGVISSDRRSGRVPASRRLGHSEEHRCSTEHGWPLHLCAAVRLCGHRPGRPCT